MRQPALTATNADEFEQAIFDVDLVFFNFVFADRHGAIGHRASGLIPVRITGGATPNPVTGSDNWRGFIPKDEMPGERDPEKQWVGTANHDTREDAYPYYYASQFAPHYRYSRMIEVLDGEGRLTPEEMEQIDRQRAMLAADEALAFGITSFQDAGSSFETIDFFRKLEEEGNLPVRLYVMVRRESNELMDQALPQYKMLPEGNDYLTVRS